MSPRSKLALASALAVTLLGVEAAGEPIGAAPTLEASPVENAPPPPVVIGGAGYLRLRSWSHVQTDGGSDLRVPPGYFMDEENYNKLDLEVRRLQELETRLTAENRSLRESVSGWQPGWKTLALTLAVGVVAGFYGHSKL